MNEADRKVVEDVREIRRLLPPFNAAEPEWKKSREDLAAGVEKQLGAAFERFRISRPPPP